MDEGLTFGGGNKKGELAFGGAGQDPGERRRVGRK